MLLKRCSACVFRTPQDESLEQVARQLCVHRTWKDRPTCLNSCRTPWRLGTGICAENLQGTKKRTSSFQDSFLKSSRFEVKMKPWTGPPLAGQLVLPGHRFRRHLLHAALDPDCSELLMPLWQQRGGDDKEHGANNLRLDEASLHLHENRCLVELSGTFFSLKAQSPSMG